MPKTKLNVEGVIERITDYQAWIADGKLGDERNRLNPILNEAREALQHQRRQIRALNRRLKSAEKPKETKPKETKEKGKD